MSLKDCLKKHKIDKHEKAILKGMIDDMSEQDMDENAAARAAVQARIDEYENSKRLVLEQVAEQGGELPQGAAQAPVAEQPTEVERFSGMYGKGMTMFNARRELKRLQAEKPDLAWSIEPDEQFGFDRYSIVGRKSDEPAALFSRSQDDVAFAQEVLNELAAEDALFRYPLSNKSTLEGVFQDVLPDHEYAGDATREDEKKESGADRRDMFKTQEGTPYYVFQKGRDAWIDVSRLQEGERGSGIYAAVLNWAHNSDHKLIGDPAGLSEAAVVRRTWAMLSSALRFGSTKHMEAAAEQQAGNPDKGIKPLAWQGDDVEKTRGMIDTALSTLEAQNPDVSKFRFDFARRQFVDANGESVGGGRFVAGAQRGSARASRSGEATLRSGILIRSLVSSESGQRPGILEQVLRGAGALAKGPLEGAFKRGAAQSGVDKADLEQALAPVIAGWANGPKAVNVVQSYSGLPKHLYELGVAEGAIGPGASLHAVYDNKNKSVYLIADHIESIEAGQFALLHETLGHYGLRSILGKEHYAATMRRAYMANAKVREKAQEQMRKYGYPQALATEEVLADMAAEGETFSGLKQIMAAIQRWLRDHGMGKLADWLESRTGAESAREHEKTGILHLLGQARAFVENGDRPHFYTPQMAPAFSREMTGEDRPAMSRGITAGPAPASPAKDNTTPLLPRAYKAWAQRSVDRIHAVFDLFGKLEGQHDLLKLRNITKGKIGDSQEFAKALGKVFAKASEADKKAAHAFLITAGADPAAISDPKVRQAVVDAKDTINAVGDMLVEMGLIDERSREENRDAYLPQLYMKYLADTGAYRRVGAGKRPSDLGYTKGRKIVKKIGADGEVQLFWQDKGSSRLKRDGGLQPLSREDVLALGPINDPGFLSAMAIARPMRDMAVLEYMEGIAQDERWVLPGSVVQWGGRPVSAMWLKHRADLLRRNAQHFDEAQAKEAQAIAAEMDRVADEGLGKKASTEEFVQVPDSPRWGMLRGMYVRKEILDDLQGMGGMGQTPNNFFADWLDYGGKGSRFVSFWKTSKVALNLPGQVRNYVSNNVTMFMSGVPSYRLPDLNFRAWHEFLSKGDLYQRAKATGIFHGTFAAQELSRLQRDLVDLEIKTKGLHPIRRIVALAEKLQDFGGEIYGAVESVMKLALIMDRMDRLGMSLEDAAIDADKWLIDYSNVPNAIRYLRGAPVMGAPFLCVDEQTEILTQRGWLSLDEVKVGDIAASLNMETRHLQWKPVLDVYREDYGGRELMYVNDRHLDMAMTPDHRCVTYRQRRVPGRREDNVKYMSLEIVRAHDLNTHDHIPTAAHFDHEPVGDPVSDSLVDVIGWYVTEGHVHRKCDQIHITQNEGEKAEWIRRALFGAGFTWGEQRRKIANSAYELVVFNVHARHGRTVKQFAPGKQLTPEFLMRLTKSQIQRLVDAMIAGDGHVNADGRRVFVQNPGGTLETFQMALQILGISFNVRPHGNKAMAVLLRDGKNYCVKRATFERKPYHGRIWCPQVADNATWVARRNGKPFITHNTYAYKMAPLIAETALKRPHKLIALYGLGKLLSLSAAAFLHVEPDDIDKLRKALPDWLQKNGATLFIPFKDEHGRWSFFDASYFLPWTYFTNVGKGVADVGKDIMEGGSGIKSVTALTDDLGVGGPFFSLAAAIKLNIDPFTKRPITTEGAPAETQLLELMNYSYDFLAPPMFSSRGFVSPMGLADPAMGGKLTQALTGQENKFGEPRATLETALLNLFGMNIYPVDLERARAQNLLKQERLINETLNAAGRELSDNSLSDERREKIEQRYEKEAQRRSKLLQRYEEESQIPSSLE